MLFENQRRDVRQLAHAVDDGEPNIWIIFRNLFHDRRLCKTDSDNQIEVLLGESTHGRLDSVWRARLDVTQHDRKIFCSTLHTFPRSSVERSIVLAADVEND